jgi:hypothetical protein
MILKILLMSLLALPEGGARAADPSKPEAREPAGAREEKREKKDRTREPSEEKPSDEPAGAATTEARATQATGRTAGSRSEKGRASEQEGREEKKEAEKEPATDELDDMLEKSDDELLEQFEEEVEEEPTRKKGKAAGGGGGRAQRFIQSLNPKISAIASYLFGYFYDTKLKGEGNIVPRGGGDLKKTGPHLQELELALQSAVDPYFRMDVFLSFGQSGVELEEAYFTTLALPYQLQVRLGQMRHPFGRQNQKHLHNYDFVDTMVPMARLLQEDSMGGVTGEVSWLMPLPWYAKAVVAFSRPDEEGTPSFVGGGQRTDGFHVKDGRHLLYMGRLVQFFSLTDDWGMNFGLSYAIGPNNAADVASNMTQLAGADIYLKWRPLRKPYLQMGLQAEGFVRYMQLPGTESTDWGGYAKMVWRLSKRWWVAGRYDMVEIESPLKLIEWGFEKMSDDPDYPRPIDDQHRGSVAVTFRPTEFSQLRLQYNYNHVRRSEPDGSSGDWEPVHEVFFQIMGNIGPHGAHPY